MKGLILAGGEGSRLGKEKAFLQIHGESQLSYLANEFKKLDIEPFVSASARKATLYNGFNVIIDLPTLRGPLAGIAAAFEHDPGPWMVFAVDMPFINVSVMNFLLEKRKAGIATCLSTDLVNPEPLACIWEKEVSEQLKDFIAEGGNSPSKFLSEGKTNLVKPLESDWVFNINTQQDLEYASQKLS